MSEITSPSWKQYEHLCKSTRQPGGPAGWKHKPYSYTDPKKIALYDQAYRWGIAFNNLVDLPGNPVEVMAAWIAAGTPDPVTNVPPANPLLTEAP